MSTYWVKTDAYKDMPQNAVYVGRDSDGSEIYVGKAYHSGDLLPAKVIPGSVCVKRSSAKIYCAVSYGGSEYPKTEFDVLCYKDSNPYRWVSSGNGNVPSNAIIGGMTAYGEALYIGRDKINSALTCGKVHPSHGCLYLPYGDKEHKSTSYEILVRKS